jgi:GT2 family glycosyltransferase
MARVSLILVTWNSAPFLPRCLEGIAQQSFNDIELIAVDNASADDTLSILRGRFPAAIVVQNATNDGFSRAVNQGVARAGGEFVLLLNPDAYLHADYIAKLLEAFERAGDTFGAASGKLMRAEGFAIAPTDLVDSKGIRMTRSGRHFDIGQGRRDGEDERGLRPLSVVSDRLSEAAQPVGDEFRSLPASARLPANRQPTTDNLQEVFGVSGAAAMFRMSFVRDVALADGQFLDEDFFSYREDADVAWRGRLFGWRAMYVPDALAWHVRTVTPKNRRQLPASVNMHSVKNRFLMRVKNESLYLALRNAPFEIARDLVTIAAVLTIERTSLPALSWLWRNHKRIHAKRREIQRRRRVSDRALARWFS